MSLVLKNLSPTVAGGRPGEVRLKVSEIEVEYPRGQVGLETCSGGAFLHVQRCSWYFFDFLGFDRCLRISEIF